MRTKATLKTTLFHTFEPIFDEDSRILILGSFPSEKSRAEGFYYGHPRNRFWQVLARLYDCELPLTIERKREFLLEHKIALWDVCASCEIVGSSDSSIKKAVPNDLSPILAKAQIERIFTNGATAHKLFLRHRKGLPEPYPLPSTSPANAAFSLDRLCDEWSAILQ